MHPCTLNQDQDREYLVPQLSLYPSESMLLWKRTIFFWFFVTLHYEIISSLPTQEVAKVGQRICLPITHFSPVVTYFLIIDNSQNPEINIDTILLTLVETLSQLFHWSSFSDPGSLSHRPIFIPWAGPSMLKETAACVGGRQTGIQREEKRERHQGRET